MLKLERPPVGEGSFKIVYKATWRGQQVAFQLLKVRNLLFFVCLFICFFYPLARSLLFFFFKFIECFNNPTTKKIFNRAKTAKQIFKIFSMKFKPVKQFIAHKFEISFCASFSHSCFCFLFLFFFQKINRLSDSLVQSRFQENWHLSQNFLLLEVLLLASKNMNFQFNWNWDVYLIVQKVYFLFDFLLLKFGCFLIKKKEWHFYMDQIYFIEIWNRKIYWYIPNLFVYLFKKTTNRWVLWNWQQR